MYNKPYDYHPLDLLEIIFSNLHIHIGILDDLVNPRHTDAIVCSSLVAYSYTMMGLLDEKTEWSLIEPEFFEKINELENQACLEELNCIKAIPENNNNWSCIIL